MNIQIVVFQIIVLVFSAIIHEYMHAWMADRLGDPTAKDLGRLTLNPIPHIDIFGSIILPFVLVITGSGFVIGWAKPVPFNPNNLRDKKYGSAKVALAGPMGNFITALFFGLIMRFFPISSLMKTGIIVSFFTGNYSMLSTLVSETYLASIFLFFIIIVFINLLLMVFNLVPVPPLDGSKVIMPFLPYNWQIKYLSLERYGMFLVLAFVIFGFSIIIPIIYFLFRLIVGG